MASMKAAGELDDDESEDEDFDIKGKEDDEGEPTDESEAESGDAEMVDEDRPKVENQTKQLWVQHTCICMRSQYEVNDPS